jgi:hypothetical protein
MIATKSNMKKVTLTLLAIAIHTVSQSPNAHAAETLFDSANGELSQGDLDGQGPWIKVQGWGTPYVKAITPPSLVITSLPEASEKLVGARASLSKPVTGEKKVVVSFSLFRASGDFLQIGVGAEKGVPVTIQAAGLDIGVRDREFGEWTPGFRADGQKVAPYGVGLDVRAVLDPTSNTVSIKVKNAGEPDSAFVDLYTSDKHDKTDFSASVSTSLKEADSLLVRVPGNNSVQNPNEPISAIRDIVVSEE